MKVGDTVSGVLFSFGIIVKMGNYQQLKNYDKLGVVGSSISAGEMGAENLVAVKLINGVTAVYPVEEVYSEMKA